MSPQETYHPQSTYISRVRPCLSPRPNWEPPTPSPAVPTRTIGEKAYHSVYTMCYYWIKCPIQYCFPILSGLCLQYKNCLDRVRERVLKDPPLISLLHPPLYFHATWARIYNLLNTEKINYPQRNFVDSISPINVISPICFHLCREGNDNNDISFWKLKISRGSYLYQELLIFCPHVWILPRGPVFLNCVKNLSEQSTLYVLFPSSCKS